MDLDTFVLPEIHLNTINFDLVIIIIVVIFDIFHRSPTIVVNSVVIENTKSCRTNTK